MRLPKEATNLIIFKLKNVDQFEETHRHLTKKQIDNNVHQLRTQSEERNTQSDLRQAVLQLFYVQKDALRSK